MMERLANCNPTPCEEECENPSWKVAIWTNDQGEVFHAAGQLSSGAWASQTGVGGNMWKVEDKDLEAHVQGYQDALNNKDKLTKSCYCCCKSK